MKTYTETYTIKKTYYRGEEPFSVEYVETELYDDDELLFHQKVKCNRADNGLEIAKTIDRLLFLLFNKEVISSKNCSSNRCNVIGLFKRIWFKIFNFIK